MSKKPKQPEWYLVDGVARVWDGESWLSYKWTEPKGWYEFQGEDYYWDGKGWYAKEDDEDDDEDDDVEVIEDAMEKTLEELLLVTFQIESELNTIQKAFQRNQSKGEKLRDRIQKIRASGKEIPADINEEMNSITCLREWHWKYIERYEKLIFESHSTMIEFEKLKSGRGLFMKLKRKRVFNYANDLALLGHSYISTTGNVFKVNYSSLIPGPAIRNEALKLMSERLAAASKASEG
jgi:hypothetical protein